MSFVMREDWSEWGLGGRAIWTHYIYCGRCGGLDVTWLNQTEVEKENSAIIAQGGRRGCLYFLSGLAGPWRQKVRTYSYRCEKCGFEFCHTFPKPKEDNPFGYIVDSRDLYNRNLYTLVDSICIIKDVAHGLHKIMPVFVVVTDETKTITGIDMRKGHTEVWDLRTIQNTWPPVPADEIRYARQQYSTVMKAHKIAMERLKSAPRRKR